MYRVHNSTVSKQLRYALMRESVPQPVSWDEALTLWQKKKKILMTKHSLYATINSKHYISVSGTT
ncbi:hypothetical protein [Agathobacter sp.]